MLTTTALVLVLLAPAQADAQPLPEIPADKSGYSPFNPTPRELWRSLDPERPDATQSATTIDAGVSFGLTRSVTGSSITTGITVRF